MQSSNRGAQQKGMRMNSINRRRLNRLAFGMGLITLVAFIESLPQSASAEDKTPNPANHQIDLAEGKILLTAPKSWVRTQPRVRFIDHEFAVPATKEEAAKINPPKAETPADTPKEDAPQAEVVDGRVTVMGAGGAVDANIERWIGQFSQADGSETKNLVPEAERKTTIAGLEILRVDLSGTYHDSPRPLDPTVKAVDRENYRMLAAIIVTPKLGNYFIKFYGPRVLVDDHAVEFKKMIAGLTVKN
jgi:hypothetical protein